ncbi:11661_t:CDS:2 [Funneliformis caledonium]|uniref:11661_t:CDS:1 n=1 Tax=Funneliformis caledonium TaxID=1117310 RepID=A0A9N9B7Z3_9GLOM|nr:11661_t:CDS:2 [Funneliformis caledonium]
MGFLNQYYGITQSSEIDDYLIVMECAVQGSIRLYLNGRFNTMSWYGKMNILTNITRGLEWMHEIRNSYTFTPTPLLYVSRLEAVYHSRLLKFDDMLRILNTDGRFKLQNSYLDSVSDFKELRTLNLFYADKTMYIERIENNRFVLMFLRPKRFGKSLLLSTLKYFYDINEAPYFRSLFGSLDICKHASELSHNKFLILKWDFSKIQSSVHFRSQFDDWSSGNENVYKIRDARLSAIVDKKLEQWQRHGTDMVALKRLHNYHYGISQSSMPSPIFEYRILHDNSNIVQYNGITQYDYMIVMECAVQGSIRSYLNGRFNTMNWYNWCGKMNIPQA